ncbi:hypothetical protein PJV92_05290 [Aliarcobacter butzleri]|uniref:Large polyvalent protein-associated domain-containing protein n=1 Tax=Aliarcobacter butzleri TaxID=28197 RepID=A0AAP4PY56_9BACT|nr:hypothetical protein [Aliarcobacter butzleri]MDN5051354.1 hypothetical protein [Aliarcobacter butzleri]MDN5074215.1 hypothetical protein [Aliarcobacter butzleri]MDN5115632.1 hypothetical protein [Aliarcobacter butzleri]MDN5132132.1 hypothetical protein [Aliarcobacter butzleri]
MIVEISGGESGIAEYLKGGRKKDRNFTRKEADKRVTLSGDLKVTDSIIKSLEFKENYTHITFAFKEDFVSIEDLKKAVFEFENFVKVAYSNDELNIYAEAHLPKLKSYVSKNGEVVIRKPHIHIVIPNVNLVTGRYIEPLGYIKKNTHYVDAFQELFNQKNGFESPKDNRRSEFNLESSIISRQKNDMFEKNIVEKEEILNYIIDKKVENYEEFQSYVKTVGTVKIRNENKDNEYFNIKYPHSAKGINLKEFCFSKEFIQEYSHEDKINFLADKLDEKFIEKKEVYDSKQTEKYEKDLKDWFDYKSKEIKYINQNSKFYKEVYKTLSKDEKIEILNQKEKEFYEKNDLEKEIENDVKGIQFAKGEQIKISELILSNDSVLAQNLKDFEEIEELKNIDFSKIDIKEVYENLSYEKGVLKNKYELLDDVIIAGSKNIKVKEMLVEQMNFNANEIHLLLNKIKNLEKFDLRSKDNDMSIKINIKTNVANSQKIDYLQIGTADKVGRFTGLIYDQADNSEKSSATLYVIADKVVDYAEFKKLSLSQEIEDKKDLLTNSSTEKHYSKVLKCNYEKENLTLTEVGKSYSNSQFNFKEIKPVEIGITEFKDGKKLDKNIFTLAKEFVLEKYHNAKDKLENFFTTKSSLAASNVVLNLELQNLKSRIEDLQTYNEAMREKIEAEKNKTVENQNAQKEENKQEQNKEPEKIEKKEYEFKDILDRAFDLKDKVESAREIKDLNLDENFVDMRDTALKLVENIESKSDLINLAKDEIKSLDLKESKAANLMLDNGLKIDSKESINKFVGVLKNIQELTTGDPSLDFESVLKNVVSQMKQNQNQLSHEAER